MFYLVNYLGCFLIIYIAMWSSDSTVICLKGCSTWPYKSIAPIDEIKWSTRRKLSLTMSSLSEVKKGFCLVANSQKKQHRREMC